MPTVKVKFKVTASETCSYWFSVDEKDERIVNGAFDETLTVGREYILSWHMNGNSGDTVAIVGTAGTREVVSLKESKIPSGKSSGAGYRRFTP